jgi:hypothetical protein
MALAVASSACGPSFALSRSRATRQHAAQAPAAGTRKAASRVLVAPRAFYTTGRSGYYGPGPEEARKMMDAFMSEMNARGAGVIWPGGRIWFGGNDCGAPGGSCRDGDAAGFDARGAAAQDPPAARLPVDIVKEVRACGGPVAGLLGGVALVQDSSAAWMGRRRRAGRGQSFGFRHSSCFRPLPGSAGRRPIIPLLPVPLTPTPTPTPTPKPT